MNTSESGPSSPGLSRRGFLRGLGTAAAATAALSADTMAAGLAAGDPEKVHGPGAVPLTLQINGERRTFSLEPRTTLLQALRQHAALTGAKEACDRAACGACTVLLDDVAVNSCQLLAIEAQGHAITTIEGLATSGLLTPLQQAIVDRDGLQCGFCSPGFVMTLTALLRRNPHPTEADIRRECAGHVCRCGSYPKIFAAALAASGTTPTSRVEILRVHDHALA